ncbi:MAG: hypothetical protein Q9157_007296 [Trypethelium eluteriae]
MLFGFGQGGMAALAATAHFSGIDDLPNPELSGVISIGGVLPDNIRISNLRKCKTPVLICGGERSSLITSTALDRVKNAFEFVEVRHWKKAGDGMPANREEMTPIMAFFARRLKSIRGIPKGSVEIS